MNSGAATGTGVAGAADPSGRSEVPASMPPDRKSATTAPTTTSPITLLTERPLSARRLRPFTGALGYPQVSCGVHFDVADGVEAHLDECPIGEGRVGDKASAFGV